MPGPSSITRTSFTAWEPRPGRRGGLRPAGGHVIMADSPSPVAVMRIGALSFTASPAALLAALDELDALRDQADFWARPGRLFVPAPAGRAVVRSGTQKLALMWERHRRGLRAAVVTSGPAGARSGAADPASLRAAVYAAWGEHADGACEG